MSQQRRQLKIGSRETGEIDRGLSRLRKIIKGLETDLATFHDEFDVLLKVWYRGKNQHRQSLHWRKLSGIKRVCKRVKDANIAIEVSKLYAAYFTDAKSKGAWTQIPSMKRHIQTATSLGNMNVLLNKAIAIYQDAFKTFNQLLVSLAFMPLATILIAITAALHAHVKKLHNRVSKAAEEVYALQLSIKSFVVDGDLLKDMTSQGKTTTAKDARLIFSTLDITEDDDVGMLIQSEIVTTESTEVDAIGSESKGSTALMEEVDDTVEPPSKAKKAISSELDISNGDSSASQSPLAKAKTKAGKLKRPFQETPKKKRKKIKPSHKDEIDDIFGF